MSDGETNTNKNVRHTIYEADNEKELMMEELTFAQTRNRSWNRHLVLFCVKDAFFFEREIAASVLTAAVIAAACRGTIFRRSIAGACFPVAFALGALAEVVV